MVVGVVVDHARAEPREKRQGVALEVREDAFHYRPPAGIGQRIDVARDDVRGACEVPVERGSQRGRMREPCQRAVHLSEVPPQPLEELSRVGIDGGQRPPGKVVEHADMMSGSTVRLDPDVALTGHRLEEPGRGQLRRVLGQPDQHGVLEVQRLVGFRRPRDLQDEHFARVRRDLEVLVLIAGQGCELAADPEVGPDQLGRLSGREAWAPLGDGR